MTLETPYKYPTYKVKQKEVLAWLFIALIKIDLEPLTLSLTHCNEDFLRRYLQLVRLGTLTHDEEFRELYIRKWQLTKPLHIAYFLTQIKKCVCTQSERRICELLIQQCYEPKTETENKLKPLIQKHNVVFYINVR